MYPCAASHSRRILTAIVDTLRSSASAAFLSAALISRGTLTFSTSSFVMLDQVPLFVLHCNS